MAVDLVKTSKFLSLVLRHQPDKIGICLDEQGWVAVDVLLSAAKIGRDELELVVSTNSKKRFEFNEDKTMIRACQGHSVPVELGLEELVPPARLYHGTAKRFLDSISRTGITKQSRTHVHLSADIDIARSVGRRHGSPVILVLNSELMHKEGYKFFKSTNNVWLTDEVPFNFVLETID